MADSYHIIVDLSLQVLRVFNQQRVLFSYLISSAINGAGEQMNSEKTPRGYHQICAKIGAGAPINTVFHARRPTGEICTPYLQQCYPHRDWIVTRILWLAGCEPGNNRFGAVDTAKRKIYIHGTPDPNVLGEPSSHGCLRMANQDIIELFDMIPAGTQVCIQT